MLLSEPFGQCYPTGVPPATEKQDLTFTKLRNYPQLDNTNATRNMEPTC